jgi:hypothetical protein
MPLRLQELCRGESGHNMKQSTAIQGLEAQLKASSANRLPPLESWEPPYCGDIGMAIRADGTWTYQNSPIGRMALVKLFARVLKREANGRYYLVTLAEKVDVGVEDAPFLAVEMAVAGEGASQELVFRTNVDDIVPCGPEHPLRFVPEAGSGGLKPYLHVRGRLEALLTRALYYDLVELAVPMPPETPGKLGIWSGGAAFLLEP